MPRPFDRTLIPAAPNFLYEQALWTQGITAVAGVDEAGRGALAGPVSAAAVIFPPDINLASRLQGVRDSKQMTAPERQEWAMRLPHLAIAYGVGFASAEEIDSLGIVPATRRAILRALEALTTPPEHLLVDFLHVPECVLPQAPLIKGDARSLSIAAASILAKTERDALLCDLDSQYPGYGFAQHKGYATQAHCAALARLGYSAIHRRSFQVKQLLEIQEES